MGGVCCGPPRRVPKGQLADKNVKRAVALGHLHSADLSKMWLLFKRWDLAKDGHISINDLFAGVLNEERNMFSDAILEILVIKEEERLNFGEFCLTIITYCLFATQEILKFCFFMFDKDKNGFIHRDEFILFVEMIHSRDTNPVANIISTVEQLDVDGDGKFTWAEFKVLHETFPQVLFPCFRLQISMMTSCLGLKWWKAKKNYLLMLRIAENERNERLKRKQLAMLEKQRQAAIRRDMGFGMYYVRPHLRTFYDSKYPPTTADQLVQMDTEALEEKLNRLAQGQGAIEYFAKQDGDGDDGSSAKFSERDEESIVARYKTIDQNMAEVGKAGKEGRRIRWKQGAEDGPQKKKKGKKIKKSKVGNLALTSGPTFAEKQYKTKILDVAHGRISAFAEDEIAYLAQEQQQSS